MVQVCPRCRGMEIGCPVCGAPPRRMLPRADIYRGGVYGKHHRKMMSLYGAPIWEVQGVDLSAWNGTMNFAILHSKCQYVVLRYGYGNGWQDAKLAEYYSQARAADMPVAGYWYCRPWEDPLAHAESFANLLHQYPIQTEECGDFEGDPHGRTPSQVYAWTVSFDDQLHALTSKWQMPYSSKSFWDGCVARSSRWINRTVFPANWTTRDSPVVPIDWTFKQGDYWQWEADGNRKAAEYGSTGGDADMDLERWYGSVLQFNQKYGTHIQLIGGQPPVVPPDVMPEKVVIATGELAIHNTPQAILTNVVGHALGNTIWYPYEIVMGGGIKWYRVSKNGLVSANYTRPA